MPNFRERMKQRRARIAEDKARVAPPSPSVPATPTPLASFTMNPWPDLPASVSTIPPPPTADRVIETTSAEVTVAELEAMTYNQLRAFLKENKLSAAGKKVDLLARATGFAEGESIDG